METVDYIKVWQFKEHGDYDLCFRIYNKRTMKGTTTQRDPRKTFDDSQFLRELSETGVGHRCSYMAEII